MKCYTERNKIRTTSKSSLRVCILLEFLRLYVSYTMYDITIYANVAVPVYYTVLYYHMCGTMYHILSII